MNKQRGVTITGLLFWGVIITLVAVLGMKVGPEYLDYYKILKSVKTVANNAAGKTVPQIRADYDKQADINYITSLKGNDLDISKEGNAVVIAFSFERRIPLFYNVSLLIDFEGSSAGSGKGLGE